MDMWKLTGVIQENTEVEYKLPTSRSYSHARAYLTIKRIAQAYEEGYMALSMTFVMLSYSGFWINPAAVPARVAMGIITVRQLTRTNTRMLACVRTCRCRSSLDVCTCVYTCVCALTTHARTHARMHACTHTTHASTHTNSRTHVRVCARTHTGTHTSETLLCRHKCIHKW